MLCASAALKKCCSLSALSQPSPAGVAGVLPLSEKTRRRPRTLRDAAFGAALEARTHEIQRSLEQGTIAGRMDPAARAARMRQGNGDRASAHVVYRVLAADHFVERSCAEKAVDRQTPDGNDDRGSDD